MTRLPCRTALVAAAMLSANAFAASNDAWKATAGVARDACATAARNAGYTRVKFLNPYQATSGGVSWFFNGTQKGANNGERQPLYCRYDGMRGRVEVLLAYTADYTPD